MKQLLLLILLLGYGTLYAQTITTLPKDRGKCFSKSRNSESYIDTTHYVFHSVKEEYKSWRLKGEKKKIKVSPEKDIIIQRIDQNDDSIIWTEDVEKEMTYTFRSLKYPEVVATHKLDTMIVQVIGYTYPGGWVECVCEVFITKKLFREVMDVLVSEGFSSDSTADPFSDLFKEKLKKGLRDYQTHYKLNEGNLFVETMRHMKIKERYK